MSRSRQDRNEHVVTVWKTPCVLRDCARKTGPLRGSRGGGAAVVLVGVLVLVLEI